MASSMFTFIVFVSSALLVAVQLASAQLTPRIIAIVFKNPVTKFSLTVFVFTFTFTLAVLVRIGTSVPLLTASHRRLQLPGVPGRFSLPDRPRRQVRCGRAGRCARSPFWGVESSKASIRGCLPSRRTHPRNRPKSPTGSPPPRSQIPGTAWSWPSTSRDSWPWPSVPTASLNWCPRWAISWRPETPCSASFRVEHAAGGRLAAVRRRGPGTHPGARPDLRLPDHRGHRLQGAVAGDQRPDHRGPGHRPDSSPSAERRAAGIWTTNGYETRPAGCGSSTGPRAGTILSAWRSPKSAISAARASRLRGGCGPCWRT